ncbi:MAG TPA: 2-isopropylmalate synthase, partial [Spirochaetales bacterium]|nr:2-isopropylmalate synthase [Spirochaetales bacterium]
SNIIAFPIPRNKPIIGDNAFAHEAGIHQDGVLKHRSTYEIMTPEAVGRDSNKLVLGRHSGMHGFSKRLTELGLTLDKEDLQKAYQRFLQIADRKKEVFDEDLFVIVSDELGHESQTYVLDYFNIQSGNLSVPTATVRIKTAEKLFKEAATGDGPVDAIFNAIDRAVGIKTTLLEYTVQAVTPGRGALGEVAVVLKIDGKKIIGRGSSTDILEASAKAYVSALNRYKAVANG